MSPASLYPVEVVDLAKAEARRRSRRRNRHGRERRAHGTFGPLAEAVAWFVTEPESTSAWVTV